MNENEELTITLTLDNDEEIECAVLTIFKVDSQEYIALFPLDQKEDTEEGKVFLYRFLESAEEEPTLENIEDDDEYERVSDKFDEWLDSQDFEDLDEDTVD